MQLTKTSKPTGDAECPLHIERAHEIDNLMNEKVGTRDLDDSEIVNIDEDNDHISISSDDDDAPAAPAKTVAKKVIKQEPGTISQGPVARRIPSNSLSTPTPRVPHASKTAPIDLLNTIMHSLDLGARVAREEERTARSLQATQLLTLTSQLRDAQASTDDLRNRLNSAERCADRAELELRVERMTQGCQYERSPTGRGHRSRSPIRHDRRVRRETRYHGGGGSVMWVTPSDEEQEYAQRGYREDSDIEWQHYGTPTRCLSPRRRRSASPVSHTGSHPTTCTFAAVDSSNIHPDIRPVSPFHSAMSGLNRTLHERHPLDQDGTQPTIVGSASGSQLLSSPSHISVSVTPSRTQGPSNISVSVSPGQQ